MFIYQMMQLLIKEEYYKNLTEEQKNALNNLNCRVKTYNGLLKEVVFNELAFSERYIPEELSLSSSNGESKIQSLVKNKRNV